MDDLRNKIKSKASGLRQFSNRDVNIAPRPAGTYKPAEPIAPQSTAPRTRSRKRKAGTDVVPLAPAPANSVTATPLRIPYGNKEIALKLGARYGSAGWYAPPGVDFSVFGELGWL
jgi:DNA topoisomerase-3